MVWRTPVWVRKLPHVVILMRAQRAEDLLFGHAGSDIVTEKQVLRSLRDHQDDSAGAPPP